MLILAGASWFLCSLFICGFDAVGQNISNNLRIRFLQSLLHQEIGWYDKNASAQLPFQVSSDIAVIENGLGKKMANVSFHVGLFLSSLVVAYMNGLMLAAVVTVVIPLAFPSFYSIAKAIGDSIAGFHESFQASAGYAKETLDAIHTVHAVGCQEQRLEEFTTYLDIARDYGLKFARKLGIPVSVVFSLFSVTLVVGYWFNSYLIEESIENVAKGRSYRAGEALVVSLTIFYSILHLSRIPPRLMSVMEGKQAASRIISLIQEHESHRGEIVRSLTIKDHVKLEGGDIEFRNIHFHYPTRTDVPVLKGVDLKFQEGSKYALVGKTGCGKSTILQLINRFYEPTDGKIYFGKLACEMISADQMRRFIGYVPQEPVLFATTIEGNLKFGNLSATEEEILDVCERANALEFIENSVDRFQTFVGQKGGQLSGGQKQRLAIARALLKKPHVLLMDEPTSALDNESTAQVVHSLRNIGGVTQIVVAHDLTTVNHSDKIFVMENGVVKEEGSHDELIALQATYHDMWNTQHEEKDADSNIEEQRSLEGKPVVHHETIMVEDDTGRTVPDHIIPMEDMGIGRQTTKVTLDQIFKQPHKEKIESETIKERTAIDFLKKTFAESKDQVGNLVRGALAGVLQGCSLPFLSLALGYLTYELLKFEITGEQNFLPYMAGVLVFGVLSGYAEYLYYTIMGRYEHNLIKITRRQAFRTLLSLPVSYFDELENSPSNIVSVLEKDTMDIAVGARLAGVVSKALSAMIVALSICYFYSWQLSLILTLVAPLFIVSGRIEGMFRDGVSSKEGEIAYHDSSVLLSDIMSHVRTIYSFSLQRRMLYLYTQKIRGIVQREWTKTLGMGFAFGFSQALPPIVSGLTFYVGAVFLDEGYLDFRDLIIIVLVVVLGLTSAGQAAGDVPDISGAMESSKRILDLIETKSATNPFVATGKELPESTIRGEIIFKQVSFKYLHTEDYTLKDFDLSINPGEHVALVGQSGCGKSTVMRVLLRFYEKTEGSIFIDGHLLENINIKQLRTMIKFVAQEPLLFNISIKENIRYAYPEATDDQIEEAARLANAEDFITSAPEKYDRIVGLGGNKLSGGQKQRIAIARAIVSNPKILLFDEATSALDSKSEKLIQSALEKVSQGKTTLTIAHRLDTIKNCDNICVVDNGAIVEQGTEGQLLDRRGMYYHLRHSLDE
eukprot:CAMPEP_0115014368 /NCGR_PEP_ID=MMETSP0216-20121206/26032_1 /TAXON_ID=223996 /ORGANISM="Protocruzia adherens, Strain Boccale" /LENGTH=1183 /DNA_ID=CAMNT_0002384085 /DNA_START=254 /DNA_END=3805 /DNA_ORIENTATION=+